MSKSMIKATNILDLEFEDDVHEHAITYNNEIVYVYSYICRFRLVWALRDVASRGSTVQAQLS